MHLRLEAFWRRIDVERWVFVCGVVERAVAGNRIEGTVGVHAEIWIRVVEARVEANWLSKVVLLMRMLDGKHLECGATA
jgi:hypothetical protein